MANQILNDGRSPFPGKSWLSVVLEVVSGARPELFSIPDDPDMQDALGSLITSAWHVDPAQRPNFHVLYNALSDMRVE